MSFVIKDVLNAGHETEHFLLSPLRLHDTGDMYLYASDLNTCLFLKWGPHKSVNETLVFIEKTLEKYNAPDDILWAIRLKETKRLIGSVRLYNFDKDFTQCDISYILNPSFGCKGYITEVVASIIMLLFKRYNFNAVFADYAQGNVAARKVMEHCGMQHLQEEPREEEIKGCKYRIFRCAVYRNRLDENSH